MPRTLARSRRSQGASSAASGGPRADASAGSPASADDSLFARRCASSGGCEQASFSRRVLLLGGTAATLLLSAPAWAGTYLTSAGLLVKEARRESEVLRKRLHDKELARLVHKLAGARLKIAASMRVPPEVAQAHPHLMLVLEHYERSAEAATQGEYERFLVLTARAREEEETFRAILKQLGWELPSGD